MDSRAQCVRSLTNHAAGGGVGRGLEICRGHHGVCCRRIQAWGMSRLQFEEGGGLALTEKVI